MTQKQVSLTRGTAIVSALTLLSRILGFVRDLLVATVFGAGMYADAFFVAFRIPNLLRSFVAEGAMSSAFVPVFADAHTKGGHEAQRAFSTILTAVLLGGTVLALAGIVFPDTITSFFAPGFLDIQGKAELCSDLTRIMFPFVLCVSLVALFNGALNTCGIFGASAWAQIVMNLVLILGGVAALFTEKETGIFLLAWSVIIGGLAQVIVQFPALRRANLELTPGSLRRSPHLRTFLTLLAPALLGATAYQIMIFLSTIFASILQEGSVSWLNYADRVTQLPIGVFSVALASVLLPALSRAAGSDNKSQFATHLSDSLRATSFVLIPLSAWIALFAPEIVKIAFERGAFDGTASTNTSHAIRALCLGLWGASCHSMIARAFIARRDTSTPMRVGFLSLILFTIASVALMGPPAATSDVARSVASLQNAMGLIVELPTTLGHVGIALASSIASVGAFLTLLGVLIVQSPHVSLTAFYHSTIRSLASVFVSVVAWIAIRDYALLTSPLHHLLFGGLSVVIFWLVMNTALKTPELYQATVVVKRKLKL